MHERILQDNKIPFKRIVGKLIVFCSMAYVFSIHFVGETHAGTPVVQPNPTPFFIPSHIGGDRDFHGNGPQIFYGRKIPLDYAS